MSSVLLLAALAAAAWLRSDDARRFVERQASARVGRSVTIEHMEVSADGLALSGLAMADPFASTPAFSAEHATLQLDGWALLGGSVKGSLSADEFELWVRKRGDQTNLHGLRRPRSSSRPLSIAVTLRGGHVAFIDEDRHEQIEAFGMELQSELRREPSGQAASKSAAVALQAQRLTLLGVSVDDVSISLAAHEDRLELRECVARLQGGSVRASGSLAFTEASAWSANIELERIGLEAHVRPLVAVFFPVLSGGDDDGLAGTVSLSAELEGEGLEPTAVSRSLEGQAHLGLHNVQLPADSVLAQVARTLSDADGDVEAAGRLDALEVDATVTRGWVRIEAVRSHGHAVPLPVRGQARVTGELDLTVDAVALLALLTDGGAAWIQRYTTELKFSVTGSVDDPTLGAPRPGALALGLLEAWTRRGLAPPVAVTP